MNLVNTVAPISIEDLKKYFTDKSTFYIIDYKNSTLKGSKLLTYLSNLDIPCDLDLQGCNSEEFYGLILDYMNSPMLVNVNVLERMVIHLLMQVKGIAPLHDNEFIESNKQLFLSWENKLDSLSLYNVFMINTDECKDFVKSYPEDDTSDLSGINFLKLLRHKDFFEYYGNVKKEQLKYYSKYFNEYMFKGKNMYSYWANENNPMFLLTMGIADGSLTSEDYNTAKKQSIEGISNVTSI